MLGGVKGGLIFLSVVFGALVLVDGHRCRASRRRVNECPEWRNVTETVTKVYRCDCERQGENNDDDDDFWDDFFRRKRSTFGFRFEFSWGRRRRRHCYCEKEVEVVRYYCERKCCAGWKRDRYRRNKCTIPIEDPDRLTQCDNGGTITTLNEYQFCTCPAGFTGALCESATCKKQCRNGGKCDESMINPACVCPFGFTGDYCEKPICNCANGGKCVVDNCVPRCLCQEGYTGDKCQYVERNGTCPSPAPAADVCSEACISDGDCPSPKKCCSSSCGRACLAPEELVCRHGGHEARIGETFKLTPCEECTCMDPKPGAQNGGARCAVMDCPQISNCSRTVTDAGQCCPRCELPTVKPTADPLYKVPYFRNCPAKLVVLDLPPVGTVVRLPKELLLEAVTYKDVELNVSYSKVIFEAGRGEQNYHSVIATSARDERGHFAECRFFIRVRDPYPPVFETCPATVEAEEGHRVEWDEPTASDNVGLIGEPMFVGSLPEGLIFPVGEHTVIYQAEDLQGSKSFCEFLVIVSKAVSCDCLNGGTCLTDSDVPGCLCQPGYFGDKCPYIVRNGTCPPPPPSTNFCGQKCSSDNECSSPMKCCDSGCGRSCFLPQEHVCVYGGHRARINETFLPSPCEKCFCVNPDPRAPNGGAICATTDCPQFVNCPRTVKEDGQCCPRCAVTGPLPTIDPHYKEPQFKNCPVRQVVLDLGPKGSVVALPKQFRPVPFDYRGHQLNVTYSRLWFTAGRGPENIYVVIATSERDSRGNFTECRFYVRVRDPYPPIFDTCPERVATKEGNRVEWSIAASDNVGLIREPTLISGFPSGYTFPVGEHQIIYEAEDLQGNTAFCEFFVVVSRSGLQGGGNPDVDAQKSGPPSRLPIILGACAALLLLIILLIVVGCICRQRKKKTLERHHHRRSHHHHGHHGYHHHHHPNDNSYDNAIYNIGMGETQPPPPYDNISVKEAPPKYSLEDQYEKMSPPSDSGKNAYDNMSYTTHDDAASSVHENAMNRARE